MKIFKLIKISVFFTILFVSQITYANSCNITYCPTTDLVGIQNSCDGNEVSSFQEFYLKMIKDNFLDSNKTTYYYDLTDQTNRFQFEKGNFNFYVDEDVVEYEVIEHWLEEDDDCTFDYYDWTSLDEDEIGIPDDISDNERRFQGINDKLFGSDSDYNFLRPYDAQNKINVVFRISLGNTYGYYTSAQDIIYLTYPTQQNLIDDIYSDFGEFRSVYAHELFHKIQDYYLDFEQIGYQDRNLSFIEGQAVLVQSEVEDSKMHYQYLNSTPSLNPEKSIFGKYFSYNKNGNKALGQYGAFVWYSFLHDKLGSEFIEASLIKYREAFDNGLNEYVWQYYALSEAINDYGYDIVTLFNEFLTDSYLGKGYLNLASFEKAHVAGIHNDYPAVGNIENTEAPQLFGGNYIELLNFDQNQNLKVSFTPIGKDASYFITSLPFIGNSVKKSESTTFYTTSNLEIVLNTEGYDKIVIVIGVYYGYLPTDSYIDFDPFSSSYNYPYSYEVKYTNEPPTIIEDNTSDIKTSFPDVRPENLNFNAIEYLKNNKIIDGYDDGTFKPNKEINRAEFLKILVESKVGYFDESLYQNCFDDVKDEWFAKYICYAKEKQWVEGYKNNVFKPSNSVNDVEAIKMLLEVFEIELYEITGENFYLDVNSTDWFYDYIENAKFLGILEENGSYFNPGKIKTRASVSENIYRLLNTTL